MSITIFGSYKSALRKYADFSGRLSRRGYWNFSSASFLIAFGIGIIEGIISGEIADFGSFSYKEIEFNWLTSIYSLAIFVPSYAALSRRLHDTNKSFKNLWLILIPIVGVIILLVFMLKKGDQKENTYGPVPTE